MGTLGGKFTTVEGILLEIKDMLKESNPFFMGDSSESVQGRKIEAFCDALDEVIAENSRNKSYYCFGPWWPVARGNLKSYH